MSHSDDYEVELERQLADAMKFPVVVEIMNRVTAMMEKARRKNEVAPERCDEDLTRDMVFVAGKIAAYREVLELPNKVRERTGEVR